VEIMNAEQKKEKIEHPVYGNSRNRKYQIIKEKRKRTL